MFFLDFCFCFACDAAYENTCRTESEPACGRVAEWRGGGGKDKGAWWVAATSAANRANNGLR